jgi:hypothetical protein
LTIFITQRCGLAMANILAHGANLGGQFYTISPRRQLKSPVAQAPHVTSRVLRTT